ncbi:hypothetical protein GCM10020001_027140 [Nonomuraea salmonea]
MSVWIGIDLGTQSVRALAVAGDGRVLGTGSRPLTSHRDGPRHEQDPEQWWRELAAATREALRGVPAGERVEGVAVDATSGTILLTDAEGRAVTPALMYDDRRADATRANEAGAAVWERLGYRRMQPNWALPKLLWLLRDAPPGARAAHQSDFVNRRLVGHEVATDLSNALKTGVDLIDERWPSDVFDVLGVPEGMLPAVVRPGARLGTVCAAAAEETGLPEGTPVIAGTTDGCAAQLGAGARQPGSWNSVIGTTLVLKGVTKELIHDPLGVVYSHRAPDGSWLPGGAQARAPACSPATCRAPTSTRSAGGPPSGTAAACRRSSRIRWCRGASASRSRRPPPRASRSGSRPTTSSATPPSCSARPSSSGSASTTSTCSARPWTGRSS